MIITTGSFKWRLFVETVRENDSFFEQFQQVRSTVQLIS
jgi:hypothetical protein